MTRRLTPSSPANPGVPPGKLRIYLGSAPGVGKTYAMLREGHRLRHDGRDVVVGLVETHGRTDTELQIGDLEVVPRKAVNLGPVVVHEMDVEAIIARHPEIVLVDELAHTNPVGAERLKRYLDVEALLRQGIGVITTVNVQHLESMNDLVASITGITVRETIPDYVLDDADDVQLVDLPVGALIDRLEQGKIYPSERADQALTGFFREGNLTALRELALRRTAEGVDDQLTGLMTVHGDGPIIATDRILVLADADDRWGDALRSGWRLASALRGDLLVAALAPDGVLDRVEPGQRLVLDRNLHLAEDLGAEVLAVPDGSGSWADRVDALVELVRRERVSILVLGMSPLPPRRWFRPAQPDTSRLATAMIERLDNLEVHLVGYDDRM